MSQKYKNNPSESLDNNFSVLLSEKFKIDSIINNMVNGIIVLDTNLNIIIINSIARKVLNLHKYKDLTGINITKLISNHQINNMISKSILNNKHIIKEISTNMPRNPYIRIYINPIKSNNNGVSGGVIYIQDITDIKKLEGIRSQFVSNVTHELKTPLTSIKGFIETLKNGALENKNVAYKFLNIIDIESDRLYKLICSILELSEIETIKTDFDITKFYINEIINEVILLYCHTAKKYSITINNYTDENITYTANKERIKLLISNLLDNAIKYNKPHGTIDIECREEDDILSISIKDTGIGIPDEDKDRIFERFYRVDKGRSGEITGAGLGLSIVKHIVNLYGGNIKVIDNLNSGTEFTIYLPLL